jgi:hypothetical protein
MAEKKLSKKEAVRQVVATLGMDASPTEMQKEIKERFGIEMTTGHISTTKGELRREGGKKKSRSKPKPAAQPPAGEKLTKNEAVYRAVVALGKDAPRTKVRDYVKENFGFEMDLNHVSAAKVAAVRKMESAPATTKGHRAATPNSTSLLLADIQKVRELVEKVGADNLRTLIGLIAGR